MVPFTPRLLILGPPGTPVEDAATELAEKYKFSLSIEILQIVEHTIFEINYCFHTRKTSDS